MRFFSLNNKRSIESLNSSDSTSDHSKFLEIIIYVLFLLGPLTGNIINVLFHVLSLEFQVSYDNILVAIPSFMFPFAITQLFSGSISDIKGRIPVLQIGLMLFGFAMILAALSISIEMYAIANILGGIGFGFINPVLIALMTDIAPPPDIPKKMGYLGASAALGVGLGPFIASQMIMIGWRSIYILFIIITFSCLLYFFFVKQPPPKIWKKSVIKDLLRQLSIEWRRPVVLLMILSVFLIAHGYIAVNIWTSKAIAGIIDESITGFILGLAGVGGALMGYLTGIIIKKRDVSIPLLIGTAIEIASLIILLLIGDITRSEVFIIFAVAWIMVGLSGGILFPTITYYSQVLSPKRRGALAGSLTAGYFIGIALVPTTLAPFSYMLGITGVYLAILILSLIFIFVVIMLYTLAKKSIEESKHSHKSNI